jgi:predicted deacylase
MSARALPATRPTLVKADEALTAMRLASHVKSRTLTTIPPFAPISIKPDMNAAHDLHSFRVHQFHGLRPGPRLIVLGAVHGNEVAGVKAIRQMLDALDAGEVRIRRGVLTLVPITNPLAYARNARMGDRNLNRNLGTSAVPQDFEDRLGNVLCPLLANHDVLLDLHSFASLGEPFLLFGPENNDSELEPFSRAAEEARLARYLGPRRIVEGWMRTYEQGVARRRARSARLGITLDTDPNYGVGTTEYMRAQGGYAVTLECGHHTDEAAPAVGLHAIRQAVALLGLADIALSPPPDRHEVLRLEEVTDRLHPDDRFVKSWSSFDELSAGEPIGIRHDGTVVSAPADGRIVFPNAKAEPGFEWFYFAQPSPRLID